jgi:hypothetical protein
MNMNPSHLTRPIFSKNLLYLISMLCEFHRHHFITRQIETT